MRSYTDSWDGVSVRYADASDEAIILGIHCICVKDEWYWQSEERRGIWQLIDFEIEVDVLEELVDMGKIKLEVNHDES